MQSVQELSTTFSIPGLTFEAGRGGLIRARIETEAAQGELYLHGAHVTAWQPSGHEPVLWMSEHAVFAEGKAMRGGIPICFPWFGPHKTDATAPAHGYARTKVWQVTSSQMLGNGALRLTLETEIAPFEIAYQVDFGTSLELKLTTKLSSASPSTSSFEDALHTYFAISDIHSIRIQGLEEDSYIDKMDRGLVKQPTRAPVMFTEETDRVYINTIEQSSLIDTKLQRTTVVAKSGSRSTVIWNPWIDKSQRMADFGDDEWPNMVCIETANIAPNEVILSPGQAHATCVCISIVES
jgi:glucose-6-phosphate 1-epimerase